MRNIWRVSTIAAVFALAFGLAPFAIADEENADQLEAESIRLQQILQSAKPAPNPLGPTYSSIDSLSAEHRRTVEFDPVTRSEKISPARSIKEGLVRDEPFIPVQAMMSQPEMEDGGFPGKGISPTPPSPLLGTNVTPYNTVYKMLMRFNTGGVDYFYVCTGWASNQFQVVTAGHCIYNWDPNDDGNTSDKMWANEVWLYAGQTDRVLPTGAAFSAADRIYGPNKMTYMRSYTGWTGSQNHDHDWGVVTLDRRMGNRVGWMGRESSVGNSLNFTGYPSETPYVPANTLVQYKGYDANNVDSSDSNRIYLDAFIYGGHSGGPSWRYDSGTGSRYVEGIHSTSDRVGSATDTRLTEGKRDDINTYATEDESARPPVSRAELAEYALDGGDYKGFTPTSAGRGDTIDIELNVFNIGWADATSVKFDIYASTNDYVSQNDTLMGSVTYGTLGPWSLWSGFSREVTIPSSLGGGNHYIGWIVSTTANEYGGDNVCTGLPCSNHVVVDGLFNVQNCDVDAYEPDASSPASLFSGSPQTRSICSIGEEDRFAFNLTRPSQVVLETSGASGNSRMWLYNGSGGLLEYDDDDGPGAFSRIDRYCASDYLSSGNYTVTVDESGDNAYIDPYSMSLNATTCAGGPVQVMSITVDDDTLGQSNGNNDGIADCGETVELFVTLRNQHGTFTTYSTVAGLSSVDPYFGGLPYNSTSAYGDIGPGASVANFDDFDVVISPTAPDGHSMLFSVDVTADNGGPWTGSFNLPISCAVADDEIFSNGFESNNTSAWSSTVGGP